MIDFIVSGQIPGLHLQVTFLLWEIALVAFAGFYGVRTLRRVSRSQTAISTNEDAEQAA